MKKTKKNRSKMTILTFSVLTGLLIVAAVAGTPFSEQSASAATEQQSSCNCVIFRFDDVQGWWEHDIQNTVLATFIHTHTKLTPAIVGVKYGNETSVVNAIKEGQKAGLFEVAIHGWNHDDFTAKTIDKQERDMANANAKLLALNGVKSNIFVAPYDQANRETLAAMQANNLTVLSADAHQLTSVYPNVDNTTGIANVPFTVNFIDQSRPLQSNGKTAIRLVSEIQRSVSKNGYAVVLFHPQDFALIDASGSEPVILPQINNTQLNTLKAVISQLRASSVHVASFNELTGNTAPTPAVKTDTTKSEHPTTTTVVTPEFDSGTAIAGVAFFAVLVIVAIGARTKRNNSQPALPSRE